MRHERPIGASSPKWKCPDGPFVCLTGTRDQGRVTSDWQLSLIVISSKARNLFHRDQGLTLPPHVPRTSPLSSSVFHAACALSAPAGHLPLEGKAAIRESPLLKKVAHHPCEPIRSPSTVIPSAAEGSLLHCRHMHTCALTQTTPWCFLFRLSLAHDLPLCKKDPSTSALMTRKKDGSSHIVFHTAA